MTDQDDNIAFKLFDTYFAGLPAATTPLSTEPMLALQGGTTKQVPASKVGALALAFSNLTFFVATTGSDSNPGTALLPFRTIQHAISVGLGFDFQSLYTLTINVANGTYHENVQASDGPIFANFTQSTPTGFLIGCPTSPANVKIAPNGLVDSLPIIFFGGGGIWEFDGFDLVANPNAASGGGMLDCTNYVQIKLGTVNFSTGPAPVPGFGYEAYLTATSYSRITGGAGTGSTNLTFDGSGVGSDSGIAISIWSRVTLGVTLDFTNATINLAGVPFIKPHAFSTANFGGISFTAPGNVTGGTPVHLFDVSTMLLGVDPTTITWPGGTFDPTQIDDTSNIDGFLYFGQTAGSLVDETSIYRGSWRVQKDTNQSTATRGLALWADDAGSLFPLTPPVTTFANLPATPLVGMRAAITDGSAAHCADGSCTTWRTAVTGGGGALHLLIWYNGTNWTLTGA